MEMSFSNKMTGTSEERYWKISPELPLVVLRKKLIEKDFSFPSVLGGKGKADKVIY